MDKRYILMEEITPNTQIITKRLSIVLLKKKSKLKQHPYIFLPQSGSQNINLMIQKDR